VTAGGKRQQHAFFARRVARRVDLVKGGRVGGAEIWAHASSRWAGATSGRDRAGALSLGSRKDAKAQRVRAPPRRWSQPAVEGGDSECLKK
jgi:hypothetical protein